MEIARDFSFFGAPFHPISSFILINAGLDVWTTRDHVALTIRITLICHVAGVVKKTFY